MKTDQSGSAYDFFDVFSAEVEAVSERRRQVAQGFSAADRGHGSAAGTLDPEIASAVTVRVGPRQSQGIDGVPVDVRDERGRRVPEPSVGHNLTGLALSGGGIRSAAFCLGVLQGLDSVRKDAEPQILDRIDYLSTVSGGGYMGTALISGLVQAKGRFPFASKLDQNETIETQHLRDYANFLLPQGSIDVLVALGAVLRGLIINAMIFLAIILVLVTGTVLLNPVETHLRSAAWDISGGRFNSVFLWACVSAALLLVAQVAYALVGLRPRRIAGRRVPRQLRSREAYGRLFGALLLINAAVWFAEFQAYVLASLFDSAHASIPLVATDSGWLGQKLRWSQDHLGSVWAALASAATGLVTFGGKLLSILEATRSDKTWTGSIKRWLSKAAIYMAALVVPFGLWFVYLALSFWAIAWVPDPSLPGPLAEGAVRSYRHSPEWLQVAAGGWNGAQPHFVALYAAVAVLLALVSIGVAPNVNSLHGFYRDRLSRAFLWWRSELIGEARMRERKPLAIGRFFSPFVPNRLKQLVLPKKRRRSKLNVDRYRFSWLKRRNQFGQWRAGIRYTPYLLVNTAVNLEGSTYLNRRGRNADSFIFSPLFVGSEATRYAAMRMMERADGNVDLATAMAASGAAASANMGASTIKPLTFSLSALNVRLGYWIPNPRRLADRSGLNGLLARIGPWYFAMETFGRLNEWSKNVYLTDGGHFDNLGLYELLKRRCKVIIAVDAEADPPMNFDSFIRLQRYARIDLGVRIDLPWEDIRRFTRKITNDDPHGPLDDAARCHGPHVAIGRIMYGEEESGVLLYIKASMSGDENDLVRDYKRRENEFPHETTLNQFFTEEQFEAYRTLGFHATASFFKGEDRFGLLEPDAYPDWTEEVRHALAHLNLERSAITRIVRRQGEGRPIS